MDDKKLTELLPIEKYIYEYAQAFFGGAAAFMKYLQEYFDNDIEPIWPPPVEDLLIRFCKQCGEIKEVSQE